jgi:hypothetical protein
MADAPYSRSLSPDSQPAHDAARLELRASDPGDAWQHWQQQR